MDYVTIGSQFVTSYYQTFDTNRSSLASLYRDDSQMFFEGTSHVGSAAIQEKLVGLSFQSIQHAVTTTDCSPVDGGMIVMVIGQLKADDDHPNGFSQTFYLKQFGDSLYIMVDIFRLSLHHQ